MRGMMEVGRRVNVEGDDMMEVDNDVGHCRCWKCAELDEGEGKLTKEGGFVLMEKVNGSV